MLAKLRNVLGASLLAAAPLMYAQGRKAELPDAPTPNLNQPADTTEPAETGWSSSADPATTAYAAGAAGGSAAITSPERHVALKDCPYDKTGARDCRMHWKPLAISSASFLTFQNAGNLYTGYWFRYETFHGKWWDRYVHSVQSWRWNRWKDDNPFIDDYVGHPIMGAITNGLWIQNDPKGMTLEQSNTTPYWRSRLRAMAFSTFYSFEWKMGPIGEASVGHTGDQYFYDHNKYTNETGVVELVTTPIGGFTWTLAEDALDKHVIRRLEDKSRNPLLLFGYQFLNPARGTANLLRFRPPWYRDSRVVKANSFWSDPHADETDATTATTAREMASVGDEADIASADPGVSGVSGYVTSPARRPRAEFNLPGGVHELGVTWGASLTSGHLFGSAGDVKYMPIDMRYSYLLSMRRNVALRYAPALNALAMLDWPTPQNESALQKRTRAYGSGVSPLGLQADLFPAHRVQPFVSTDAGMLYFYKPVFASQASPWVYSASFGGGVNLFRKQRQAMTFGYRYQHLSSVSLGSPNSSTDANIFYFGVSRFRTKSY